MITEDQQSRATAYALGALPASEQAAFEAELRASAELQDLVRSLQPATDAVALGAPPVPLPPGLKAKVLQRIATSGQTADRPPVNLPAGLRILHESNRSGWKALPVPGAWIKLLSLERERGYAVLLGRLDPGTRYPAHINRGPEDFYILTGDLHIGETRLQAGDFHHADAGSHHAENHSVDGCTLIAVLTMDDPLVAYAMAED
jgi:anti-sigma factor ChrR (cupin superfamily)